MANVIELKAQLKCVSHLMTIIRNQETSTESFRQCANRLITLLCEESLAHVQSNLHTVMTPTGHEYQGISINTSDIVAVSIIRAGDSMLDTFIKICPNMSVGKILIQRDETTALPKLYYHKLPSLHDKYVILLDPMLATGGSVIQAIECCLQRGASLSRILFVNLVASPEGIQTVHEKYPELLIISGEIDSGLNEKEILEIDILIHKFSLDDKKKNESIEELSQQTLSSIGYV